MWHPLERLLGNDVIAPFLEFARDKSNFFIVSGSSPAPVLIFSELRVTGDDWPAYIHDSPPNIC